MFLNNRGVSLIELMIALVVLMLVSLALMQTALVSIDANMKNTLRDEAIAIAEEKVDWLRNRDFDALVSGLNATALYNSSAPRDLRNLTVPYIANSFITSLSTNNVRIDVDVYWRWKNENYVHTISTLRNAED